MRPGYRAKQFWRGIRAVPFPEEKHYEISSLLSVAELKLFRQLSAVDQWHSYAVLTTLQAAGHTHPDLLAAALLHDIGKSKVKLTIWERTVTVLAHTLLPRHAPRWGQSEAVGWRRPFVVRQKHPQWGAELLREAGSSPLTVTLARRHQERLSGQGQGEEEMLLRSLKWADELN